MYFSTYPKNYITYECIETLVTGDRTKSQVPNTIVVNSDLLFVKRLAESRFPTLKVVWSDEENGVIQGTYTDPATGESQPYANIYLRLLDFSESL